MNREIVISDMDQSLNFIIDDARKNLAFSKKGVIHLGNFISVQRKGGNGKRVSIPKTNWEHPGNNLQFKFKPIEFANMIQTTEKIKHCVIIY